MTEPTARKRKYRASRGALWLITGLLLASGVVRFASGAGPALARGIDNPASPVPTAEPQSCEPPEEVKTVLDALAARQQALEARESALQDRKAALQLAETEIQRNMVALQEAETRLSDMVAIADTAAESDLARLTSVYENMKPKEAAALFAEMDPDFAAGFLGRMRPAAAAAIMAGLKPQSAYTISVVLAGRNARAPTE